MQERPPWAAEVTTERLRVCTPPPQFSEQVPQAVQPETLQSTGQAKALQVLYSLSIGQVAPPCTAVVRMERLRRLVPVPHVAVHAVKAVQADTRQSIGHAKVLQVFMNLVTGQVTPP